MNDIRLSILKISAIALIGLGLFLFVVSLFEPVFITKTHNIQGYWIFALGWMGFAIFQFAWYANLLSFIVILLIFKRPFTAFALSSLSLFLALQSFIFDQIPLGTDNENIAIIGDDIGLYLWIGAHGSVLYATILILIRHKILGEENKKSQQLPPIKHNILEK